jgi:hypothetical protein
MNIIVTARHVLLLLLVLLLLMLNTLGSQEEAEAIA